MCTPSAVAREGLAYHNTLGSCPGQLACCVGSWWLQEEFPEVFRFSAPVFPSEDDDVVTSPYNAGLWAQETQTDLRWAAVLSVRQIMCPLSAHEASRILLLPLFS
jgi:hypothetical protein